jgi:multicomponent Na+:H+ antiporter subunit E
MMRMIRKTGAVLRLIAMFNKELLLSSVTVLREVLRPKLNIRPGIIKLDTELRTDFEITLLSILICLTPGTLTLDVSGDGKTLYIHAMDINDPDELAAQIKGSFERAIMEVTR